MGFMDDLELRRGSSGGGSYYGDPGMDSLSPSDAANALMPFYHQVKNRELQDFKDKANFSNNLQLKQGQLQRTFAPGGNADGSPNVVYQPGPSDILRARANAPIDPLDQAKLALERDKLSSDKLDKSTDNALNEKKFGLDQQKNEQIHQNKEDDLQRKADDANNRLKLAYDQLEAKKGDASAQLAFHQAQQAAKEAADQLKDQQHTAQLDELKRLHDAQIKDMQDKLDALQNTTTVTNLGDENKTKVATTAKGSKAVKGTRVAIVGPDGKSGTVSADEASNLPSGWKLK